MPVAIDDDEATEDTPALSEAEAPTPKPECPPMTPGRYLKLRREAMDLSVDDVARMLSPAPHGLAAVVEQLTALEADDPRALRFGLAEDLHDIFQFDPTVYETLVVHAADPATEVPVPQICRLCACSWNDPCVGADHQPCSWVEGDPALCTQCLKTAAMGAAVAQAGTAGGTGNAA